MADQTQMSPEARAQMIQMLAGNQEGQDVQPTKPMSFKDFINDPNAMAQMLGGIGQSFSAQDPKSWQHQLGGMSSKIGQGGSFKDMMNKMALQQKLKAEKEKLAGAILGQRPQIIPDVKPTSQLGTLNDPNILTRSLA